METPEFQRPIYLKLSEPSEKLQACSSRFWGNPDLPDSSRYPFYTDEDGDLYPYFFICQINLEEIAPFDPEGLLPHKGLLSFFAKIDNYIGYDPAGYYIGGHISDPEDVKVLYFPDCTDFQEVVLVDDNDEQTAPQELQIEFAESVEKYGDDHALFARPDHREWETWDTPFEDWKILLQIDSFEGRDFHLNFMDFGVLDLLISPDDLRNRRFDNVRAIVLST